MLRLFFILNSIEKVGRKVKQFELLLSKDFIPNNFKLCLKNSLIKYFHKKKNQQIEEKRRKILEIKSFPYKKKKQKKTTCCWNFCSF